MGRQEDGRGSRGGVTVGRDGSSPPARWSTMRVVVWNLAANTVSRAVDIHRGSWDYLRELDPDLALLQEAQSPEGRLVPADWAVVHAPYRSWGSLILAKPSFALSAFNGPSQEPFDDNGLLASGWLTLPDGAEVLVGSIHSPIGPATDKELAGRDPDAVRTARYKVPYRRDVVFDIYRERVAGKRFLVGGDWNTSPFLWDQNHSGSYEVDFFSRAEQEGWVDCYQRFHPGEEGQTWFRGKEAPYQNDHVFCDPVTAGQLLSCEIDPRPARDLNLSDHAPMLLEFALMR